MTLNPGNRLPLERCSVCKWEPHATECTCLPVKLLERGDITEEEAYLLIGISPPPDGDPYVPEKIYPAPRQSLQIRLLNAWGALKYALRHGERCSHGRLTGWHMLDARARQIRWCRTCGHTEFR